MAYGICNLSIVPIRQEPAHRSEQASQLLFGETFTITDQQNEWIKILTSYDEYEGWIQRAQFLPLELTAFNELQKTPSYFCYDLVQILINHQQLFTIVLGSTLPLYRANSCRLGETDFTFEGNARLPENNISTSIVLENAFMYLNAPYLWGGRSPFGIDCSGFTQMVFKLSGIKLKRDAWMQAEQGTPVHLLDESQPGDLAFFDNEEGKIIHVGILTAKNRIIHSSGKVRIDSIDHHGIFNQETKRYSHNLRLIKRIL